MTATADTFTNYATSTVAGGSAGSGSTLGASDTTLLVATGDGSKFPSAAPFMLQIGSASLGYELVKCTARSTDTLTITRGQEGTAAVSWAFGTALEQVATAGNLANLWTTINRGRAFNVKDYGAVGDGTTDDTAAIQAAITALPSCSVMDGGNNLVSGQSGVIFFPPGVYKVSGLLTLPSGDITIQGSGWSSYIPDMTISAFTDYGGTAIVGTAACATTGVLHCPQDAHGQPSTMLNLRDLDIRMESPAAAQTSAAPAILDLAGWMSGELRNVNVLEVLSTGGIGTNMYVVCNISPGAGKDTTNVFNLRGFGGHTGVRFSGSHISAIGVTGGHTGTVIDQYAAGIDIRQDLGNYFANLHAFNSNYGLAFYSYSFGDQPFMPQVVYGIHFEAVSHYVLLDAASMNGCLILDGPIWDQTTPNPDTDIAASLSASTSTVNIAAGTGVAVITRNEYDIHNLGTHRHVTVPPGAWTAGASPYTLGPLPYAAVFVLTTVGGMTALTLDGQALFNGSFTIGQNIYVGAGHTLVATWATTAPVFQVLPI